MTRRPRQRYPGQTCGLVWAIGSPGATTSQGESGVRWSPASALKPPAPIRPPPRGSVVAAAVAGVPFTFQRQAPAQGPRVASAADSQAPARRPRSSAVPAPRSVEGSGTRPSGTPGQWGVVGPGLWARKPRECEWDSRLGRAEGRPSRRYRRWSVSPTGTGRSSGRPGRNRRRAIARRTWHAAGTCRSLPGAGRLLRRRPCTSLHRRPSLPLWPVRPLTVERVRLPRAGGTPRSAIGGIGGRSPNRTDVSIDRGPMQTERLGKLLGRVVRLMSRDRW